MLYNLQRSHVFGDFNCPEPDCSCGFGTSRGLQNHLLIFHGIRDESLSSKSKKSEEDDAWLIDCLDCEITFTSNRKLEAHRKVNDFQDNLLLHCINVF